MKPGTILITLVLIALELPCLSQQPASIDELSKFEIPETDEGLPGDGPIRRYDWFRDLWKSKRSTWASRIDEDRNALVFLGNSITQGWGDDFRGAFSGAKLANRGISGDTTRGMLIRLQEDVLSLNPTGIVMLMGTNDLEEKASPETISSNLELIIHELKNHDSEMPIVLCLVFPSSETKNRPADRIRRINELYSQAVKGDLQVIVLDTWTLFANEKGDAKIEEFPDLLHPNEAGYMKWAAALNPVLETLGFLTVEVDNFRPEPGFEQLFNGTDLTGWGFRPTSDEDIDSRNRWLASDPNAAVWPIITETTVFDGEATTDDGRFLARNNRIVVTIPAEGRRIQQLWTNREFGSDFVLRLEFRATPNADSGIFIRGKQLQCRDYLLAGPYTSLKKYKPLDWNEIEIRVEGTSAHCTCNGEVLEESLSVPEIGPIGLEGDRGQVEYRRIRIQLTR
jgi:lysophospholipase L1-like esterase